MPPHKSITRVNNTQPTPPLPPPQHMDTAIFQASVTAAMAQININGASGSIGDTNNTNQGDSQGHPRECSYKDFTNCKPKSLDDTDGVTLTWFEKTKSVFEICACPGGKIF